MLTAAWSAVNHGVGGLPSGVKGGMPALAAARSAVIHVGRSQPLCFVVLQGVGRGRVPLLHCPQVRCQLHAWRAARWLVI